MERNDKSSDIISNFLGKKTKHYKKPVESESIYSAREEFEEPLKRDSFNYLRKAMNETDADIDFDMIVDTPILNVTTERSEVLLEKRGALIDKQKGYAEEIRYLKQPQVDKELEQKRLNTINNLDPKRFLIEKDTLQHKRKGRVILKKPDPNKPSKFGWELKINSSDNEISIEKKLIKRPKKYMMSMSTDKNPSKLPDIKIDYLQEIKEKNLKEKNLKENSSANTLANKNYAKSSEKKWNKMINDNKKGSFIESINDAKNRVELIDNQALLNQKLLNSQEPTSNNIELNKKVSNLLIDSIEAKLSLLNKMK